MKSPFAFALAATAALAVAQTNDYASVVSQVQAIQGKVQQLTGSINDYQGGNTSTIQAIGIELATIGINNMVKKTTTAVNGSLPFGDDGSNAVGRALLVLQPDLYASLDALVAKHDAFVKPIAFGIPPTLFVKPDLTMLKKSTDGLGAALIAKFNPPLAAFAPAVVQDIDEHFDSAIAAY